MDVIYLFECNLNSFGCGCFSFLVVFVNTDLLWDNLNAFSTNSSCDSVGIVNVLNKFDRQIDIVTFRDNGRSARLSNFDYVNN